MKEKLPTFIIIGAGKSGTTALHNYCEAHPQVFMTSVKETNFFELEGHTINHNQEDDPEQLFHYPQSITTWEDYRNLFSEVTNEVALGETSPMYLYGKRAPQHIKEKLPDVKLIAILREPVNRLYSRWTHLLRDQNDPVANMDFSQALDKDTLWWKRNDLVREGMYYTHISRYFELFDRSQLKVFLFDDLRNNSELVMQELFDFIGVDSSFKPDLDREYNVSGKPKNPIVDSLIGTNSILINTAKKLAPGLVEKIKQSGQAQKMLTDVRKKNMEKPVVSDDVNAAIYKKYYQEEVEKLEGLLQRDLSKWKKYS